PETQDGKNNLKDKTSRLENLLLLSGVNKLPQLFNVILGQMSLVGPRPITKEREHQYGIWLSSLVSVKPGMTGPWAVENSGSLQHEISQN
ncbi:MAG: sugar transferase, partial [candidate division Zixibacteria bacterium]|nr:sugar transferase [candidate division Zixibacteria bacterium]